MFNLFQPGHTKHFSRIVRPEDCATFEDKMVHPVYATFALARDAEWCCRLFVLDMKESFEEGIGTQLTIDHISPALVGSQVDFTATILSVINHEITCSYTATIGTRLVAKGVQVQKILKKEKLQQMFEQIAE